jgi:DTW domain-containing protein
VTRTRLVLLIHRKEDRKPTNTGRLAAECLQNSEIHVRGHHDRPSTPLQFAPNTQPLLLFPHEDATPLGAYANLERPISLVIPDGTWRQASKVRKRVPGLAELPCVTLPPGPPSMYRLRFEAHEGGLATLEAIARAIGILESDGAGPSVQQQMEDVFRIMVERTLWCRGAIDASTVTGGVPAGSGRHGPRT